MIYNFMKLFKRAQADRGLWVGIDPLIFMLRHHPRRRDVYDNTHLHIKRGVFNYERGGGSNSHGIISWHAADMSPRLWMQISMPDDDTIVIDELKQKLRPMVTTEELHEAGKELVEQLAGHRIKLAGRFLADGKSTGDHMRCVRALGIAE